MSTAYGTGKNNADKQHLLGWKQECKKSQLR